MSVSVTIRAAIPEDNKSVEIEYDLPISTSEAIEAFGESAVAGMISRRLTIEVQNEMRDLLRKNKTPAEIEIALAEWRPEYKSIQPARKIADPEAKKKNVRSMLSKMSAEERREFIASLEGAS